MRTFFVMPTRLASDGPAPGLSFEGALCRLSLEKIFCASASFFFLSRPTKRSKLSPRSAIHSVWAASHYVV